MIRLKQGQSTREQQDAYAIESVRRAKSAQEGGDFERELTPVTVKGHKGDTVVTEDEGPKNARPEKIPSLRESSPKMAPLRLPMLAPLMTARPPWC